MDKKTFLRLGGILFLTMFCRTLCVTQNAYSEWIASIGTPGWDILNDMTCDDTGNIYMTGSYTDTVISNKSTRLATNFNHKMYIAKLDTAGKLIWKKDILTSSLGFGSLIAKVNNNQLILVGGEVCPNSKQKLQTGKSGFFISGLNGSGEIMWTQHFSGSKLDYLTSLVVDTLRSEILISGYFHDTVIIGEKKLLARGASDGLFLRFDHNGNLKSSSILGGKGEDKVNCITIDNEGSRYVAGTFQRKIQLDVKTTFELSDRKKFGLFLSRYDYSGKITNAKHFASGNNIRVHAMTTIGELTFIAGSFGGTIFLDSKDYSSRGGDDIFLLCFDNKLQIKWCKQIGGIKKDRASKLIISEKGILISGSYGSTITIDQVNLSDPSSGSNIFVAEFDISGNLHWIRIAGGNADNYPTSMIAAPKNNVFIAGSFREDFNMNGKTLRSSGEEDVFVGRIENCHFLSPSFPQPEYLCLGTLLTLDAGAGFVAYNWADGLSHNRTIDIVSQGKYSLELISSTGCNLYDTVTVIDAIPPSVNLGNDTTIADTSLILLHAWGNFSHCLWNNGISKSENLIKGIDLYEGDNYVGVKVTNDKGCIGEDEIVINLKRTLTNRLSDLVSGNCVLFPNPANDLVTVYFTIPIKSLVLTIHDQLGKELLSRSVTDYIVHAPIDFNLGTLSNGLYTLYIKTEYGFAVKKIILQ